MEEAETLYVNLDQLSEEQATAPRANLSSEKENV
jgi:hypothetical protein